MMKPLNQEEKERLGALKKSIGLSIPEVAYQLAYGLEKQAYEVHPDRSDRKRLLNESKTMFEYADLMAREHL